MKIKASVLIVLLTVLWMTVSAGAAEVKPPQVGQEFPDVELSKPVIAGELKYLGLSGSGSFRINQIKADVVIVEIFSMYCPHCQAEAPAVNKLYPLIEDNAALRGKIKMIGIGTGNSIYETDIFRKKYSVKFPLVPDGDFKIHKIMGEVRTPYFIVVKLKGKKADVIYSKAGALGDNKTFLKEIIKSAGLK